MNCKKILISFLLFVLACVTVLTLAACSDSGDGQTERPAGNVTDASGETVSGDEAGSGIAREGVWEDAMYLSDRSLGEGAKTIRVQVIADGSSVTFTLHTDADTLGAALLAENLIEGDKSTYGLYIKKVNGITADYDVNRAYWSISKDGDDLMTGADSEKISDGAHYELTYTK